MMNKKIRFLVSALLIGSLSTMTLEASASRIESFEEKPPIIHSQKSSSQTKTVVVKLKDMAKKEKMKDKGKIIGEYQDMRVLNFEVPEGDSPEDFVRTFKGLSEVEYAYVDEEMSLQYLPSDPYYSAYQWNLRKIGMESVWDITKGSSSVLIAVVDSGYGALPDVSSVVNGADFSGTGPLEDTYPGQYSREGGFHGTAIISLTSSQLNQQGIAGMAPGVSIMPVKVFPDGAESTNTIKIAAGIRWAADHGADIINLSVGGDAGSVDLKNAIDYAVSKGSMIIAASGNDGYANYISYPAAYDGVIAVGSTNSSDAISSFSNKGSHLDLVAPGESIALNNYAQGTTALGMMSGTSFSAPTVTAAAGLLMSRYPSYSHKLIESILLSSTTNLGTAGWDISSGHGLLDVRKAFEAAAAPDLIDGNDELSRAVPIALNTDYQGRIFPLQDVDYYTFAMQTPDAVKVNVVPGEQENIVIELYNQWGSLIGSANQGGAGVLESLSTALAEGSYYVKVFDYNKSAYTEAYGIRVDTVDVAAPVIIAKSGGSAITDGMTVKGSVEVTVTDQSQFSTTYRRDGVQYPYPSDGIFTEAGYHDITATDIFELSSRFSFAISIPKSFLVSFESNGGSPVANQTIAEGSLVSQPVMPSREGYLFMGWFRDEALQQPFDFALETIDTNTKLYAKWEMKRFDVNFESNGGSLVSPIKLSYGSLVPVPVSPIRAGYRFEGWYTSALLDLEWDFTQDRVTKSVTLYARWTKVTNVDSVYGSNRYLTAVEVSKKTYLEAEYAILVLGSNFPDALSAGPLAIQYQAPILLTRQDTLPDQTLQEMKRLGVSKAIILGGDNAVRSSVVAALEANGMTVERLAGPNRYATAVETAKAVLTMSGKKKVVLTNGLDFPDALSAGSYAGKEGLPILLTRAQSLPVETREALISQGITDVQVLGGPTVVSEGIITEITSLGINVSRAYGSNRFNTSVVVAGRFFAGASHVVIANGMDYADALSAVPLAVKLGAPIMLVRQYDVPDGIRSFIESSISNITIVGGESAISETTRQELIEMIQY